jgi:hypothetical protein
VFPREHNFFLRELWGTPPIERLLSGLIFGTEKGLTAVLFTQGEQQVAKENDGRIWVL